MSNKSTSARRASAARSSYAAIRKASDAAARQLVCPHPEAEVDEVDGFPGLTQCSRCGGYGPF
jgi:hypothetical protein